MRDILLKLSNSNTMDTKKVGVLGSGDVGRTLAKGFMDRGYDVMVGSRNGTLAANVDTVMEMDVATGTFKEVAAWADLVVLAVKGSAAEGVASECVEALGGKTVIDVSNPIADDAPEHGVLKYFTSLDESLAERIQNAAPDAKVVKAWNSVGHVNMVDPDFGAIPTMPICGDDDAARKEVAGIITTFGWEVMDMGALTAARAIEPLAMLICIPGFTKGDWGYALKLLHRE
jgi:predicted dinucleotide-binding enzyme